MWNDEDNNPYSSFVRRDSTTANTSDNRMYLFPEKYTFRRSGLQLAKETGFRRSSTPNSDLSSPTNEPPEFVSQQQDSSDSDNECHQSRGRSRPKKKKGGYDSRVEQILYENPDLQIVITDAGKSHEGGGSFIVYTIRTGVGTAEETVEGPVADMDCYRILKCGDDIPNLVLSGPHSSICIPRWLSHQFRKSIPWPIMQRNPPKPKKTWGSSTSANACLPSS